MLKSTLDKVHNEADLVTPVCIGRRVLVANANNEVATTGILRFVGPLEGQNGVFCGVELFEPLGKNDGSYKGVYFFQCPANHGLFLPIHRVQMAEKQSINIRRPDKLIKSAFANIHSSGSSSHGVQFMDESMMSTNSSNWINSSDDDGDMFDSCTTYNVARPQFMLQEIEDPRPLIAMDDDSSPDSQPGNVFTNGNVSISASYVVTHPTMDPSELPIIGTPPAEDLETPLVEENPINGNFLQQTKNPTQGETKNTKNGNVEEKQPKPEKKQRVSIREIIAAPPKPVEREKPKKVSKQQQLMDQILQNMKEQKETKKKQPRTRISDLWTQPPQKPAEMEMTLEKKENFEDGKSKRTVLKSVNQPPAKPRNPPKPRQSLLPPKPSTPTAVPKTPPEGSVKFRSTVRNVPGVKITPESRSSKNRISSENSDNEKRQSKTTISSRRPTSQASATSSKSSTTSKTPQGTSTRSMRRPIKPCSPLEKKLINHYKRMYKITTVMGLVAGNLASRQDALQFKYALQEDLAIAKNQEIEHLKSTIKNLEESYKNQIENLKQQHQDEFEKFKITKDIEHQQAIKELKEVHQTELDERDVSYLHVDSRLKESQKKVEELRKALNEDTDEKVHTLNLEVKSLQDMLEIKNKESVELLKSKNKLVILQEKFYELEKEHKALQCEHEQESYNFKMNRDVNRSLREENNRKDYKIEELQLKIDKLEKRLTIYQQRVDELETINHAAGLSNPGMFETNPNEPSFLESDQDFSESDVEDHKNKRQSLLATYQEAGRKIVNLNESVHQDVIHLPEGRFRDDIEENPPAAMLGSDDPDTF